MTSLAGAEKMVVTITFEEHDGKTMLRMHTLFASIAMKNEHTGQGFVRAVNSGLDQLEELVARM